MNKKVVKVIITALVVVALILATLFRFETVETYKTQQPSSGNVAKEIDFTTYWYPVSYTKISLGAFSDIKSINVREGYSVKKGEMIVEMKDESEYNQYKAAQASYSAAAAAKNAASAGTSISIPDLGIPGVPTTVTIPSTTSASQIQAQVNAAYYQMKNAELNLNKRKVFAPFDGKVLTVYQNDKNMSASGSSSLPASLGISSLSMGASSSSSSSGGNYLIIVSDSDARIVISLSEQEIAQVKKDMPVTIRSRVTDKEFSGVVSHVSMTPSASSAVDAPSYEVTIALKEFPAEVPYGGKLEGAIVIASKENVATVPFDAVTIESFSKGSLLVLENGTAVRKTITLGIIGEDVVEITEGLETPAEVIIDKEEPKQIIALRPWLKKLLKK